MKKCNKKMNLIMIRHPVTEWNINGKIQPVLGGDIAERGYIQLNNLMKRLENEEIDAVYSSDSLRCLEVAARISESHNIPLYENELFREKNNGRMEGCLKKEANAYLKSFQGNYEDAKTPNGESLNELYIRSSKGLDFITSSHYRRVALISHASYLYMLLGVQLGLSPIHSVQTFKFSNCAMSETKRKPNGIWGIEYLNNRDYLK